ncbi:MAG: cell envelope integrity protein CreD [Spirochaetes bacterium]|nr:cell envelope integrity protein CreD [Spirochaetota bacterium]
MENFFSFLKSVNQSIKSSLIVRIILITFLILLLLIPSAQITNLIHEREGRRRGVISEINSKWADSQTIIGPVIEIPYIVYNISKWTDKNGIEHEKIVKNIKYAYFLPNNLQITGEIIPEYRKRGIYSTVVYTVDLNISGNFTYPDFAQWKISKDNVLLNDAEFSFGMTDMRGINNTIEMTWNNRAVELKPGVKNNPLIEKGVYTHVYLKSDKSKLQEFNIKLNLRGSIDLSFLPLGKKTNVKISSKWPSPSFNGYFLPKERNITEKEFRAEWEIFDYNRDYPQSWTNQTINVANSKFGVELFMSVDEYQKTYRSTNYSVLFIILTFAAVFILFEISNKKRFHPIQYLMVGFSIIIFYLLLLSLSEHIAFNYAYIISSLSVIAIITFYAASISKNKLVTLFLAVLLIFLYSFLYFTLQLEDYSLLVGSIGLFLILTFVMIFTRKIDWYSFKLSKPEDK